MLPNDTSFFFMKTNLSLVSLIVTIEGGELSGYYVIQ